MWPFKKKAKAIEPNPHLALINKLMAWRAVGDEFEYLGRRMIVTGHYRIGGGFPMPMFLAASLSADYADDVGVLHRISFSGSESAALMLRQPNGGIKPRPSA